MNQENGSWQDVLNVLKSRMSKPSFDTWFKATRVKIEENKWMILVANEFARDWLDERYMTLIKEAIYQATNERPDVTVMIDHQHSEKTKLERIIEEVYALTPDERERLLSILNNHSNQEPPSYEGQGELPISEKNRITQLENEMKLVKDRLEKLGAQLQELR